MCKSTLDARSVELYLTKKTVPGVFRYRVTTTNCPLSAASARFRTVSHMVFDPAEEEKGKGKSSHFPV